MKLSSFITLNSWQNLLLNIAFPSGHNVQSYEKILRNFFLFALQSFISSSVRLLKQADILFLKHELDFHIWKVEPSNERRFVSWDTAMHLICQVFFSF